MNRKQAELINNNEKTEKSSGRNFLYAGLLASALFFGCNGAQHSNNNSTEESQVQTEVAKNEVVYKGKGIEGVDGILLCENPETMRLFLSDGKEKLTEEFDDIQNVCRMDGVMYFVGINNGKPAIINESGDTIFSGLDCIKEYRILNGDVAVIGGKNIGENNLGEKINRYCYIFNDKVIFERNESDKYFMDGSSKNGIYVTVGQERKSDNYGELKNEWNKKGSRLDDSFIYVENGFVNDKKVSTSIFPIGYVGGGNVNTNIIDYGEKPLIVSSNFNGKDGSTYTLIYNGRTIGSNLNNVRFIGDSRFISYEKNGKRCILFPGGKEYFLDKSFPDEINLRYLFINDGKKSYVCTLDGEIHEYEGKFNDVVYVDSTSDGKIYFIGKKGGEIFVFDGKIVGKTYDHISGAGLTESGSCYVRGERDGKKIFVLNGTERGIDHTISNSQERNSDLFVR